MNEKIPPVGPLGIALRRRGAKRSTWVVLTAALAALLLVGVGLLLLGG